ncbi:MAG: GNAT family N-acetyltransferase [Terracidiphilus sp.]
MEQSKVEFDVRFVNDNEQTLIFSFLCLAARMPEGHEPIQKALSDSFLTKYWFNWGRPGDLGAVAIESKSGMPISCSWIRVFSKEEAGNGFVGEGIPELATGTVDICRNQGIGKATLDCLISKAQSKYAGICLSVREDNPALRLYERLGFRKVAGSEMTNRLGTQSANMLLLF